MGIIEKWKNRETKKKLREENIRLKSKVETLSMIQCNTPMTIERNVQRLGMSYEVDLQYQQPPEEYIKSMMARKIAEECVPFLEWGYTTLENGKAVYKASLYVATGDKRH